MLPALVLPVAAAAVTPSLTLHKDFSPNPMLVENLEAHSEVDLPYTYHCGSGYTSKEPLYTFALADDLEGLRIRFGSFGRDLGAIVIFPDGSWVCTDDSVVYVKKWPHGTYKVFHYGVSAHERYDLEFEQPDRSVAAVQAAVPKLPVVTLGDGGPNPVMIDLPHGPRATGRDLGSGCVKDWDDALAPIAKLDVKSEMASAHLSLDHNFVLYRDDTKKCQYWDSSYEGSTPLHPGTYTLYALMRRRADAWPSDKTTLLEIDDPSRGLVFHAGGAPVEIKDLSKPLVLSGKVRAPEPLASRLTDARCDSPAAFDPDLLVHVSDREHLRFQLLFARTPQELRMYGPLEAGKDAQLWCPRFSDDDFHRRVFDEMDGTYAVWVDGKDAQVGGEFHIVVTDRKTELDPFQLLVEPPKDLPMEQRAFSFHYPFLSKEAIEKGHQAGAVNAPFRLFTEAPEQLFVFAKANPQLADDIPAPGTAPVEGEPLLVVSTYGKYTTVQTHEGMQFTIKTRDLTVEHPAKTHFLDKPRELKVERLEDAIWLSGPEDQKAIQAAWKLEDKYDQCFIAYVSDHDPTWGRDVDVYEIRGGEVKNVSDEVSARADAKCGAKKVEKSKTNLKKALDKSRDKRRGKELQKVKQRWGA